MPRVQNYPDDNSISDSDRLLGTDGDDNSKTKNYSVLKFVQYLISRGVGTTGPTGPQGPVGPQGPPGANGAGVTYLEYQANITQVGSANPTPAINRNTLGYDPLMQIAGTGGIAILITDLDPEKTEVYISPKTYAGKQLIPFYSINGNVITIKTFNRLTDAFENDMLISTPVHIIINP